MTSCNKKELEFCVFVINILAERLNMITPDIYKKLNNSQIIDEYIIPCYDVLHTLGNEYLIQDITNMMQERGVLA